jgi:hypothetical protein
MRIGILLLIFCVGMCAGCSPRKADMPLVRHILTVGQTGSLLEYYEAARSGLSRCDQKTDDECLLITEFFWGAGHELIRKCNQDGKYDDMLRYAQDFIDRSGHVMTLFPGGMDGILEGMRTSKEPVIQKIMSGHDLSGLLKGSLANAHYHSALYYALHNDPALVDKHREEIRAWDPQYLEDLALAQGWLEDIRRDQALERLFRAVEPLGIGIGQKAELAVLLRPLYDALHVSPDMTPEALGEFLKQESAAIEASLIDAEAWWRIYTRLMAAEDAAFINQLLVTGRLGAQERKELGNVVRCSFINLLGTFVLQARGFQAELVVTADKPVLERLSLKTGGRDESGKKPDHVVCLIRLADGGHVFFDLLNAQVSPVFSLADDYFAYSSGYYEMLTGDGIDIALYRHFLRIPPEAFTGETYSVLAMALRTIDKGAYARYLERALNLWPENYGGYISLAGLKCSDCIKDDAQLAEVLPLLERASSLYRKHPVPYDQKCILFYPRDRSKSIEACARSIELWEGLAPAVTYDLQARNFHQAGRHNDAREHAAKAAEAYGKEGDHQKAAEMEEFSKRY